MDNILFFDTPLHKNSFSEKILNEDGVIESLLVTMDGTIMGVDSNVISKYMSMEESRMIRLGMRSMPDNFKIECRDTFYKYLSYQKLST